MTTGTIIFYLFLIVIIFHETRKIKKAELIYNLSKEIKKEKSPEKQHEIFQNNPEYKIICYLDMMEMLLLIYGIFTDLQWPCFLGIFILSLSKIQKLSPLFVKIDSILTVIILFIAFYNTILCVI